MFNSVFYLALLHFQNFHFHKGPNKKTYSNMKDQIENLIKYEEQKLKF